MASRLRVALAPCDTEAPANDQPEASGFAAAFGSSTVTLAAGAGTGWHRDPALVSHQRGVGRGWCRRHLPMGTPAMEPPRAGGPQPVLPRGRGLC